MKHPPYHLRPNKAVDRLLLVDLLRHWKTKDKVREYRYVGLGGPFLEDLRVLAQAFPGLRLTSIEKNQQTLLRQGRHISSKGTTLIQKDFTSYLNEDFSEDELVVVWLDYTNLKLAYFADLRNLLPRVRAESIIKFSVPADPERWLVRQTPNVDKSVIAALDAEYTAEFNTEFDDLLDPKIGSTSELSTDFPAMIQRMVRIAAQKALPANSGMTFQILCSATYSDGTPMISITGMVCETKDAVKIAHDFSKWQFANTDWSAPKEIDVPDLSLQERIWLERHLPCKSNTGKGIQKRLGYKIDSSADKSLRKLKNFQDFYSLYPQFVRIDV